MAKIKRIGILTSGGDCAGLNSVIRAVVHRASRLGWEVIGIREGSNGLLERPVNAEILNINNAGTTHMLRMGGTILGAISSGSPFALPQKDGSTKDVSAEIIEGYKQLNLDALIGIGGDGSLAILKRLAAMGEINLVAIPKTIDNDVGLTETSIGYDTAVQVAVEALDRLQPTAASHNRVMILEVMGRDAGHIALNAGIAGGADIILIPEVPYSIEGIVAKIQERKKRGREFALAIVAEAVHTVEGQAAKLTFTDGQTRYGGIGEYLAACISKTVDTECRVTVLGHLQRGGTPSPHDRILGTVFGVHAVELIAQGKFGRMVSWQNREVVDVSIDDAISSYRTVRKDGPFLRTAQELGIYVGDLTS